MTDPLRDALRECEEYFEGRAADEKIYAEEMWLLAVVQAALRTVEPVRVPPEVRLAVERERCLYLETQAAEIARLQAAEGVGVRLLGAFILAVGGEVIVRSKHIRALNEYTVERFNDPSQDANVFRMVRKALAAPEGEG